MSEQSTPDLGVTFPITCRSEGDDEDCGSELTKADYVGMRRPPESHELPSSTGTFYTLSCPDCGDRTYICPVCDGGAFQTDDGTTLMCHNCKPAEARRQDRKKRELDRLGQTTPAFLGRD